MFHALFCYQKNNQKVLEKATLLFWSMYNFKPFTSHPVRHFCGGAAPPILHQQRLILHHQVCIFCYTLIITPTLINTQPTNHEDSDYLFKSVGGTTKINMKILARTLLHIIITRSIKKNIFNKMKEDVGMLKPQKHVNKVGRLT